MNRKIPRNTLYFSNRSILKSFEFLFSSCALEGDYIRIFEDRFANFIGAKHAIAVSSGKLALYLCLKALGAREGDKIILSDFNVPEVPALLVSLGLQPVLVDIDYRTFNINLDLIEKNIDGKTKFLLVTHMFGAPIDMKRVLGISEKYNLTLIEDACQAVGAEYEGERIGCFGKIGYFSFGTLKVFSTFNGGMILTNEDATADLVRNIIKTYPFVTRQYLLREIFKTLFLISFANRHVFNYFTYPLLFLVDKFNSYAKFNFFKGKEISHIGNSELDSLKKRFTNLQAVAGLENLKALEPNLNIIRERARVLDKMLKEAGMAFQVYPEKSKSSYFKYVIRVKNRDMAIKKLFKYGIDVTYGYMTSCSEIENFKPYSTHCPESQSLTKEHIYLPIHSLTSHHDISFLVKTLKKAIEGFVNRDQLVRIH